MGGYRGADGVSHVAEARTMCIMLHFKASHDTHHTVTSYIFFQALRNFIFCSLTKASSMSVALIFKPVSDR